MNHNDFFSSIKAGKIHNLYLLEGTEEYIKQQALAHLCKKLLPPGLEQMNYTSLDNPEADVLVATAETLPFMGEWRVLAVRDCDLFTTGRKAENDTKAEALLAYLQNPSPTTCLVFTIKGKADKRKKLYTALKKQGALVEFSSMGDGECAQWAQRSLRAMGKEMDGQTAAKLVFTVGRDAALLKQEMDKLYNYAGERVQLTPEDIEAVCTKSLECTVFQLVDAQVAGKNDVAFRLLSDMERNGEDSIGILAMLLRQYRILYHMRCLLEEGVSQASQASLLGIPPFTLGRTQQQARLYPKENLKAAYDYLLRLEFQLKSGRIPQEGCAQAALVSLHHLLQGKQAV